MNYLINLIRALFGRSAISHEYLKPFDAAKTHLGYAIVFRVNSPPELRGRYEITYIEDVGDGE